MKRIRIGNDFAFVWAITRNSLPEDLTDVSDKNLYIRSRYGAKELTEFTIVNNMIRIEFTPTILDKPADYNLQFIYTLSDTSLSDQDRKCTIDTDAFSIVPQSSQADVLADFSVTSDMAIGFAGKSFTYEDFTPEQIIGLKQPSTDAAMQVIETVDGLVTAVEGKQEAMTFSLTDDMVLQFTIN